ncbi:hypothetical protein EYR38_002864 [Pleurotus pulmonarius]|nr:hypothetical protein EYR38_002864 [Pleurotus pulmonarius]
MSYTFWRALLRAASLSRSSISITLSSYRDSVGVCDTLALRPSESTDYAYLIATDVGEHSLTPDFDRSTNYNTSPHNDAASTAFWNWESVGEECKCFIGPAGYGYVQESPPNEHIVGDEWWTDYQAVSYKLESKRGNRAQFAQTVTNCHAAGVKVIADTLFNHMSSHSSGPRTRASSFEKYNYPSLYSFAIQASIPSTAPLLVPSDAPHADEDQLPQPPPSDLHMYIVKDLVPDLSLFYIIMAQCPGSLVMCDPAEIPSPDNMKERKQYFYGRMPEEEDQPLMAPNWADPQWHWEKDMCRTDCESVPPVLKAAPPAPPPDTRSYPQAQTFTLYPDPRFLRGYRYGTPFNRAEKDVLRQRLLHISSPPEVKAIPEGTKFKWLPLSGMVQMIPGIPMTYDMPSGAPMTIACLHTPASLLQYGLEGQDVLDDLDLLSKMMFGHKAQNDHEQSFIPIYTISGLKRNSRSAPALEDRWDGSYSLASTRGEGEGKGVFLPAVQNDTASSQQHIGSVLNLLHKVWRSAFRWSVSKFERDMVEFNQRDNNTFAFGGLEPGATSLQMNVSSQGVGFQEAIGRQGSWHVDCHDDPREWTMAVLFFRLPINDEDLAQELLDLHEDAALFEADPGPFILGRSGLYVREGGVLRLILWFKGRDIHTGHAPSIHPTSWTNFISRIEGVFDRTDPTNRVMYVCYPSEQGIERTGNMAVMSACHFGNANVTLEHQVMQRNFADHGMHVLGGQKAYANRLGRELFYGFFNALNKCNLKLSIAPDDILGHITYEDDEVEGKETPLLPSPPGFHPVHDRDHLSAMRAHYRWYMAECDQLLIVISKSEYLTIANAVNNTLSSTTSVPLPTERQATALQRSIPDSGLTSRTSLRLQDEELSNLTSNCTPSSTESLHEPNQPNPTSAGTKRKSNRLSTRSPLVMNSLPHGRRAVADNSQKRAKLACGVVVNNDSEDEEEERGQDGHNNENGSEEEDSDSDDEEEVKAQEKEGIYRVKSVVGFRLNFHKPEWKVRWHKHGPEHDTWQDWGSLTNCVEAVEKYNLDKGIKILLPQSAEHEVVAIPDATVSLLTELFSSSSLQMQLDEIRQQGHAESKQYFTHAKKQTLRQITTSLAERFSANNKYHQAFAESEGSDPLSLVDSIFSQLDSVTCSLPVTANNLKILQILHRCQVYDACRSFRIIYHWMAGPATSIAELLLSRYIFNQDDLTNVRFGPLVKHIVEYARGFHRKTSSKKSSMKSKETTALLSTSTPFTDRIDQSCFLEYGFDIASPPSRAKRPTHICIPKPPVIACNNTALLAACQTLMLSVWAEYYIEPHTKAMDQIICGSTHSESKRIDYTARAITRGAVLTCIVDAFGSEAILYSSGVTTLISTAWVRFGSAGDNTQAPKFAETCRKRADEIFRPVFKILVEAATLEPESKSIAEEMADVYHEHLVALNNGHYADFDALLPDSVTRNGQDSSDYKTKQPQVWEEITTESLIGTNPALEKIMPPISLILREACNASRHMEYAQEELHRVLEGHYATVKRNIPFDADLTNPNRRYSLSTTLFFNHLPPDCLTTSQGLPNLLSWLGTGQGRQTQKFLARSGDTFFTESSEALVSRFEQAMTHNDSVLMGLAYKPGRSINHIPYYIPVDNPRIWGQPCRQLSVLSKKQSNLSRLQALHAKFDEYFSSSVVAKWKAFLGELLDQNPKGNTLSKRSWQDALDFVAGLGISGFKNGLTTLQAANLLVFAGIVEPPQPLVISGWIFSHKDLGAFHGLQRLGFKVNGIASVVAAFYTVHNHLQNHLSESDKANLGCSQGLSAIFVEHLLCKIVRWEGRLRHCHITWDNYPCNSADWVQGRNEQDPLAFPIPTALTSSNVDDAVATVAVDM